MLLMHWTTTTTLQVVSFLQDPPADGKYEAFKLLLLTTFELSEPERAHQLLALPFLGNQKPLELMDHMLSLLGFIFHELFMQQMPAPVRSALACSLVTDFCELVREADRVYIASWQSCTMLDSGHPSDSTFSAPGVLLWLSVALTPLAVFITLQMLLLAQYTRS